MPHPLSIVRPLAGFTALWLPVLLAGVLACAARAQQTAQGPGGIAREDIQRFFMQDETNSTRTAAWFEQYVGRTVQWRGQVYKVRLRPESHRVEILVRVMPDSMLYDTVAVLEGRTTLDAAIRPGATIAFTGRIFRGVDWLGVKEVQVLVPGPEGVTVTP